MTENWCVTLRNRKLYTNEKTHRPSTTEKTEQIYVLRWNLKSLHWQFFLSYGCFLHGLFPTPNLGPPTTRDFCGPSALITPGRARVMCLCNLISCSIPYRQNYCQTYILLFTPMTVCVVQGGFFLWLPARSNPEVRPAEPIIIVTRSTACVLLPRFRWGTNHIELPYLCVCPTWSLDTDVPRSIHRRRLTRLLLANI